MSLDKAIEHGKEHRVQYGTKNQPYCKSVAKSCRNHGSCTWCRNNRIFSNERRKSMHIDFDNVDDDTMFTATSRIVTRVVEAHEKETILAIQKYYKERYPEKYVEYNLINADRVKDLIEKGIKFENLNLGGKK